MPHISDLLPPGAVARLFKRHNCKEGIAVKSSPTDLDICASRAGGRIFLHVANLNYSGSVEASFAVGGMTVTGGRVLEIAPENPRQEISPLNPDVFKPVESPLSAAELVKWRFPARSVSVVDCRTA